MSGFLSEKTRKRRRCGCISRIASAIWLRRYRAYPGPDKSSIEAEIDLGHARHRGEALLVFRTVDAEGADVVERALLEPEKVLAVDELAVLRVLSDVRDGRLVNPGGVASIMSMQETNS